MVRSDGANQSREKLIIISHFLPPLFQKEKKKTIISSSRKTKKRKKKRASAGELGEREKTRHQRFPGGFALISVTFFGCHHHWFLGIAVRPTFLRQSLGGHFADVGRVVGRSCGLQQIVMMNVMTPVGVMLLLLVMMAGRGRGVMLVMFLALVIAQVALLLLTLPACLLVDLFDGPQLLFEFHPAVLEPDFDLALRQAEGVSDLDPPPPRQVVVEVKLFLQLERLVAGVRLAASSPRTAIGTCTYIINPYKSSASCQPECRNNGNTLMLNTFLSLFFRMVVVVAIIRQTRGFLCIPPVGRNSLSLSLFGSLSDLEENCFCWGWDLKV